jgi:hypothetical protein
MEINFQEEFIKMLLYHIESFQTLNNNLTINLPTQKKEKKINLLISI